MQSASLSKNMIPKNLSTFSAYVYDSTGGEGVDVYVIDTGINIDHVEFEGRAHWGHTAIEDGVDEDGNGHGTHCAGTIASAKYGVAKKAQVHAVKVLGSNGSGPMSDVIAGVVWASNQAQAKAIEAIKEFRATGKTSHKGSVANMSLGGSRSPSLDTAIDTAVRNGMHFAVAAGNDNRDACSYSPAGAELAVTVGASTIGDERAYFSNYGKCVDIFAPGLNIKSTWIGDNTAQSILSGTSMASPHVAGLLAYYLSIRGTATFNPVLSGSSKALVSNWNPTAAVMAILPNWMSAFIPASFIEKNMPVSVSVESFYNEDGTLDVTQFGGITPAQLKKALIELGERDKLNDLPPETVNILAFNNATNAAGYPCNFAWAKAWIAWGEPGDASAWVGVSEKWDVAVWKLRVPSVDYFCSTRSLQLDRKLVQKPYKVAVFINLAFRPFKPVSHTTWMGIFVPMPHEGGVEVPK
ncbi:serine-type endopeptidase [Rhizoctonia solani AG-1 IA]|uniref:Serine-type endopeptidase n=1 Tax=Thanatephorus cucumeris (strain AG1-IA) TaxID=983506 RepID=L8X094_THACA|nr:serine-type endopeptidase [Rhizoctonia solani AG-1 IA]